MSFATAQQSAIRVSVGAAVGSSDEPAFVAPDDAPFLPANATAILFSNDSTFKVANKTAECSAERKSDFAAIAVANNAAVFEPRNGADDAAEQTAEPAANKETKHATDGAAQQAASQWADVPTISFSILSTLRWA